MRLIASLIITLALSFNLFAVEIPQFKNKIALEGATVYKTDENGNLIIITFADYDYDLWEETEEVAFKVFDKPTTNIYFLDKINPYNTNELHYYNIYTNKDKKIETNYFTYIVEKNILLYGVFDEDEGWGLNSSDPYDYNSQVPHAIFVDYEKYGKKYIENLMSKDLSMYSARYFEGKYISEDDNSYFDIKRRGGNIFAIDGFGTIDSITTNFDSEFIISELYPELRKIYIEDTTGDEAIYQIHINIFDPNTLIVFEGHGKKRGFKGIYTKVKE